MNREVLLISCPDQPGLIHNVTGVLLRPQLNVTETHEFVDPTSKRFFTRIQFEGHVEGLGLSQEVTRVLPKPAWLQMRPLKPRKVVLFVSNEPHCLGDLLLRDATGEWQANILAVISQTEKCRKLTERFEIPFHHVSLNDNGQILSREDHEKKIHSWIQNYKPDYLILARYMRILSPSFVQTYKMRILNIHHSFLPAFIGKNPYQQAHVRGVKMIGATAHFVTEELDEGPIIAQSILQVTHADDPTEMARRGQDIEKSVLARATELVLEDRVLIDGARTIIFD